MFKFEIGDDVCYASDRNIHQGTIIGRKIIEAPEYHVPMHELCDRARAFDQPGNRLGAPCIRYEIRWFDERYKTSSVIEEEKLFTSPWGVSEHFAKLAEGMTRTEDEE